MAMFKSRPIQFNLLLVPYAPSSPSMFSRPRHEHPSQSISNLPLCHFNQCPPCLLPEHHFHDSYPPVAVSNGAETLRSPAPAFPHSNNMFRIRQFPLLHRTKPCSTALAERRMGRRKQSNPVKRSLELDVEDAPEEKQPRIEQLSVEEVIHSQPSSSKQTVNLPARPFMTPPETSSSTSNALKMLERSLTRLQPKQKNAAPQPSASNGSNGLGELLKIVGRMVPGHAPASTRRDEDECVSAILKCLQCGQGYSSMEQLVKHMQTTRHFNNLPRSYSSLVQLERQKVLNLKLQVKSEGIQLGCSKCGQVPSNIDRHLKDVHDVRTSSEWLKAVSIVRPNDLSSPLQLASQLCSGSSHLNKMLTLIQTVHKK